MVDVISLLSTDGYIMCNKTLIKLYGADCAILVGELCAEYNYYKARGELTPADSFYSTQENIEANTGLNAYAQRKALNTLREDEVIVVTKQGMPAKNYYWINADKLCKIFTTRPSNFEAQDLQNLDINNNRLNKNKEKEYKLSYDNLEAEPTKQTPEDDTVSDYESHGYSKEDFLGSNKKVSKPRKKKNLYEQCMDEVVEFTQDMTLYKLLGDYLRMRLAVTDKPMRGVNQWKGMLNKLSDLVAETPGVAYEDIVKQSIERGYLSFYPITKYQSRNKKDVFSEGDKLDCTPSETTAEERMEALKKAGKRYEF